MENNFAKLNDAFDFFNKRLFNGELADSVITVQRKRGTYGYFRPDGFQLRGKKDDKADEVSLNPEGFDRSDKEILSTLVHEMAHKWQRQYGKPSRSGYHNRQWADKMESLGLIPSDSGSEGGKRTGQKMTHYIAAAGRFDVLASEFLKNGFKLDWKALVPPKGKRVNSKIKYSCPNCAQNAWAKPEARLICGDCEQTMEAVD